MIGLLLIEISAFHGFRWAEEVLGDTELVAGDGEAATLVSYIRADETPHVAWLRTALSEMRDRTWVGSDGRRPCRDRDDRPAVGPGAAATRSCCAARTTSASSWARSSDALAGRPDGDDLMEEMLSLGSVVRAGDGTLTEPPGPLALG